ncbi:Protein TAR1 [Capsicum baccatum]|uniref:Protein TAR1 n=1 Tax=Capsicum baccatum TaxID=33114 RepID=A0A2G2UYJ8_CAPBA|nr:Protein TAR1 [Capsicum baccatum]
MIGRADIEGSKSNVAMNAWLPQASYPCGNFSDTSSFEFRRSKGSLGHAFTMCRPIQNPHLTMSSARISPQSEPWVQKEGQCPASESRNNRIPLVRTSSELAVRRAGKAPEGTVPSLSPGRHAATHSRRGSSSSSPPTADGFRTGTPVPSPQSQSFSRSYGSILPTSLAYIVPSTRGCSPWRPDAVMSTTGRGRHSVLRIFKGRRERTGHHATCGALPAAGPYLRLSRFQGRQSSHLNICYYHQDLHRRPLRPGSRPRFCSDSHALLLIGAWNLPRRPGVGHALKRHLFSRLVDSADERFARQYRCGPALEFHLASPRSGIVHHLSGPDRYAHTRTLLRRSRSVGGAPLGGIPPISFLAPYGFTRPLTRTHVRLLGPCFKTGRMGSPQASVRSAQMPKHAGGARCLPQSRRRRSTSVSRARALAAPPIHAGPRPESIGGPARRRSTSDRGASPAPIRFPPDNFKHSLTLFSKSFSSFPRGTCSLSVSRPYLALDGIHRPIWAAFPNNPTRRQRLVVRQGPGTTGLSPSPAPPSRGLGPGPPLRTLLQTTIRTTEPPDSKAGLFPIRSPLLRESM